MISVLDIIILRLDWSSENPHFSVKSCSVLNLGLYQYQIEKLEEVDLSFFRQLFNSHSKTASEFYYSETGKIPAGR